MLLPLAIAQYTNIQISFQYASSFHRRPALLFSALKVFLMIGATSLIKKKDQLGVQHNVKDKVIVA